MWFKFKQCLARTPTLEPLLVLALKGTEPDLSDVIGKKEGSAGHCGFRAICVLVQVVCTDPMPADSVSLSMNSWYLFAEQLIPSLK